MAFTSTLTTEADALRHWLDNGAVGNAIVACYYGTGDLAARQAVLTAEDLEKIADYKRHQEKFNTRVSRDSDERVQPWDEFWTAMFGHPSSVEGVERLLAERDVWLRLTAFSPADIAAHLETQHPQMVTVLVKKLLGWTSQDFVEGVLRALPSERLPELLVRMALLEPISSQHMAKLVTSFHETLCAQAAHDLNAIVKVAAGSTSVGGGVVERLLAHMKMLIANNPDTVAELFRGWMSKEATPEATPEAVLAAILFAVADRAERQVMLAGLTDDELEKLLLKVGTLGDIPTHAIEAACSAFTDALYATGKPVSYGRTATDLVWVADPITRPALQ